VLPGQRGKGAPARSRAGGRETVQQRPQRAGREVRHMHAVRGARAAVSALHKGAARRRAAPQQVKHLADPPEHVNRERGRARAAAGTLAPPAHMVPLEADEVKGII